MKPELETKLSKLERDVLKLAWILMMTVGFVLIFAAFLMQQEM